VCTNECPLGEAVREARHGYQELQLQMYRVERGAEVESGKLLHEPGPGGWIAPSIPPSSFDTRRFITEYTTHLHIDAQPTGRTWLVSGA
jgi:hypothetical protein